MLALVPRWKYICSGKRLCVTPLIDVIVDKQQTGSALQVWKAFDWMHEKAFCAQGKKQGWGCVSVWGSRKAAEFVLDRNKGQQFVTRVFFFVLLVCNLGENEEFWEKIKMGSWRDCGNWWFLPLKILHENKLHCLLAVPFNRTQGMYLAVTKCHHHVTIVARFTSEMHSSVLLTNLTVFCR